MKLKMTAKIRTGRRLGLALALGAALGLAACGGSTSRVENFHPDRIVVFGDELSVLGNGSSSTEPAGSRYGINGVDTTTGVLSCSSQPIWVQALATSFGLSFAECGGTSGTANKILAAYGATVAQVTTQFDNYRSGDTLDATTLVAVMAGVHDVLVAYEAYVGGSLTRDQALAQVGDAGASLASLVNRMAANGQGGRIVYATIPDLGYSPRAVAADTAAGSGTTHRQLLKDLSARFNEQLRVNVLNDGRYVGLVTGDEILQVMAKYPTSYGLSNVTEAACLMTTAQYDGSADSDMAAVYSSFAIGLVTAADERRVIGCSNLTLVTAAAGSSTAYLWADDIHPSPAWHSRVGSAASSRAHNNPF